MKQATKNSFTLASMKKGLAEACRVRPNATANAAPRVTVQQDNFVHADSSSFEDEAVVTHHGGGVDR